MKPDQDCSAYYIDDILLLRFLITRFTDMLGDDIPRLSPVWNGLGLVALYQNKEMENAFQILISSDSYTDQEVLSYSIDFFLAELNRLETADTTEYLGEKVEHRPLRPSTARKFLFWSWREGRKMGREQCFRFYLVWELISWLALRSDEEIKEFDEKCRFSESPVEVKLEDGLQIVKAAIFKRKIDGTSFQNN